MSSRIDAELNSKLVWVYVEVMHILSRLNYKVTCDLSIKKPGTPKNAFFDMFSTCQKPATWAFRTAFLFFCMYPSMASTGGMCRFADMHW